MFICVSSLVIRGSEVDLKRLDSAGRSLEVVLCAAKVVATGPLQQPDVVWMWSRLTISILQGSGRILRVPTYVGRSHNVCQMCDEPVGTRDFSNPTCFFWV